MGFQIPTYSKLQGAYKERRALVMKLTKEGKSQAAIARQLGISRARVNQILKAEGT